MTLKMTILGCWGLLLAGCASASGTSALRPLAAELTAGARVAEVRLAEGGPGSQEFRRLFQSRVQDRLDRCATGSTPLVLEVVLDEFRPANVLMAALIPAQSRIDGTARLRDSAGVVVGEFRIRRSLTAGGVVGATLAAQAETAMSEAFGDEVCKQAFSAR